jgi:hypothetical protein
MPISTTVETIAARPGAESEFCDSSLTETPVSHPPVQEHPEQHPLDERPEAQVERVEPVERHVHRRWMAAGVGLDQRDDREDHEDRHLEAEQDPLGQRRQLDPAPADPGQQHDEHDAEDRHVEGAVGGGFEAEQLEAV